MSFPGSRIIGIAAVIALPIVAVGDLGSIAVVQLAVPDDAREAGRAAVQAIEYVKNPTSANAKIAYEAASSVARLHRQQVDPETFTIYSDGAVELTVTKTAPTLVFKHLPGLRDLARASNTTTVERVLY